MQSLHDTRTPRDYFDDWQQAMVKSSHHQHGPDVYRGGRWFTAREWQGIKESYWARGIPTMNGPHYDGFGNCEACQQDMADGTHEPGNSFRLTNGNRCDCGCHPEVFIGLDKVLPARFMQGEVVEDEEHPPYQ